MTTCGRGPASLRAHATQVDPSEAFWFGLSDEELADVYPYEDWILARSVVGEPAPGDDGGRPVRRRAGVGTAMSEWSELRVTVRRGAR